MATPFDEWLAQLRRSGRLMPRDRVTLVRGQVFTWFFSMTGNWSTYIVSAGLRLYPDAPGASLLDFTVGPQGYDGTTGRTTWQLTATAAAVNGLPADGTGEGLVNLAMEVLIKPAVGNWTRLMAGVATVSGRVKDGV